MYEIFFSPFIKYSFMKMALSSCLFSSIGCIPVGVLLILRRMSLMGDALSHSILPGVAIGYIYAGLSSVIIGIGGAIAGILVVIMATLVSRHTILREDASFVSFYLIALAIGTIIISIFGKQVDLMHIIYGQILSVPKQYLYLTAAITSFTLIILSVIYRPLVMESYDPIYMKSIKGNGGRYHMIFMLLVVINMVAAFQILGTLMTLGLMLLPAIIARLWARTIEGMFLTAFCISCISCYLGLIFSFHYAISSGPSIVLFLGIIYIFSIILGRQGGLFSKNINWT